MIEHSPVTLLLVAVTVFTSYKGFTNSLFREKYAFAVDRVLMAKEYIRLLTSGFLHTTWMHLIFNMIALYAFGSMLEPMLGIFPFLLIYFLSLVGGNLMALLIHKHHGDYSAVGASGAVNGIIYAGIALFPSMGIGFFLIPLSFPAWAFGLAYMIFTIYGIKARWGNSGHAAHLGGAVIGMLIAIALYPQVLAVNWLPITAIALPTIAFILLIVLKPEILLLDTLGKRRKSFRTMDHEYNYRKNQEQADIDAILEKIHKKGMKSLTRQEKEALENYSRMKK
jgi:membrane associated rhomboid family serine protease